MWCISYNENGVIMKIFRAFCVWKSHLFCCGVERMTLIWSMRYCKMQTTNIWRGPVLIIWRFRWMKESFCLLVRTQRSLENSGTKYAIYVVFFVFNLFPVDNIWTGLFHGILIYEINGGVVLVSKDGHIVCENTLDARLECPTLQMLPL